MTLSRWFSLIWIGLMLIACDLGAMGQASAPSTSKTVTEVFDRSVSGPERATLSLAERMLESSYNFAPTRGEFKGVRTFAQLAKHIAVDNYLNGAALLGEKPSIKPGPHENGPDSIRTKAEGDQIFARLVHLPS